MEELTKEIKYLNKPLLRLAMLCKYEGYKCYAIANNTTTAPRFDELFISNDDKYYINVYTMFDKAIYISTNNAPSDRYGDGTMIKIYSFKEFNIMKDTDLINTIDNVCLLSKNLCEKEKLEPYSTKRQLKYYKVSDLKR